MKITFKIEPETLFLVQKIMLYKTQHVPKNKSEKVRKSIELELFQKLSKKCISYTDNTNGKARSITLKYHLADALLQNLLHQKDLFLPTYEANKLEMLKNELHQKLL